MKQLSAEYKFLLNFKSPERKKALGTDSLAHSTFNMHQTAQNLSKSVVFVPHI